MTDKEIKKVCDNCLHYNICSLWSTTDLEKEEHHKYCYENFTDRDLINRLQAEVESGNQKRATL